MTQQDFLRRLVQALDRAGIPFMICGSLGSGFHGEPRATADVDLVISPTEEKLNRFVGLLGDDFYVNQEAAVEAHRLRSMFNVIDHQTGWKADLIIQKARPFSQEEFSRRQPVDLTGVKVHIATAEDIVLSKLEWASKGESERQFRDAVGVAVAQGNALDREYLQKWATELGVDAILVRLLDEVERLRSD